MDRNHSIDAFRGLAIVGMVFFTLNLKLSSNLPDLLRHNVWNSVHLGDFVLPMFLFASGLSLAYFLKKNKEKESQIFIKIVVKRFLKLAFIGVSLSIFSAYGFLEMDEVMLSALLFIGCILLSKFDWKINIGVIFLINASYVGILHFDLTSIFIGHYLGGYPAALFYLQIMLVGLLLGKGIISENLWCTKNKIIMAIISLFFLIFLFLTPLNKMTATPSFILLSILFSFFSFVLVDKITKEYDVFKTIQYIGAHPLRYWLMMYILFLIPLWFYITWSNTSFPLTIDWIFGVVISICMLLCLYLVSRLLEYINLSI